jgi:uncharacterized protein YbjT (DUF2867 family)
MKTVAIAGASGFIGRWFIETFKHTYKIIALSRKAVAHQHDPQVEWRQVEMYSITSTTNALKGADYALYLVHSMSPSTRLNQGSFDDTDLLLADNFARAAAANNLAHIIFVGGILPKESSEFSPHLRSRHEVECTLGARKVPVTTLRGGIIIGPGGSSFQIVEKLVRRLPVLACPKWTLSESQPISLRDMLTIIDHCFGKPEYFGKAIEIGGPEVVSYREVLQRTAQLMGKKRWIFPVPFFSPGLSKFWVGLFSDSSPTFVAPLVESLRHTMTVNPEKAFDGRHIVYQTLDEMIADALHNKGGIPALPKFQPEEVVEKNTVRSYQRLPNPRQRNAIWVAGRYTHWLPRFFKYFIKAKANAEGLVSFSILGQTVLQLQEVKDRSNEERQLFYIVGGLLVKRKDHGWLEFRSILNGRYIITAIHEFVPSLPWYVYVLTQAPIHLWVMKRFGKYLQAYS